MRVFAPALGIVLIAACSPFATKDVTAPDDDGGTSTLPDASVPREAGPTDADPATRCGALFAESFDDQALPGWTASRVGTNSQLGIGTVHGSTGKIDSVILALGASTMFTGSDMGTAFVEKTVPAPNVVSAHLEVDFLYAALDSFVEVGCALGLVSTTPAREARIDLQMGNGGFHVASSWLQDGAVVEGLGSLGAATLPAAKAWTHVVSDVAITNGKVALTMTFGGNVIALTPLDAKDAAFDSIHVACGIVDAYAGMSTSATVEVFLDDLSVSTCTK